MDQSNQTPKAPENQEQKNDAGSNASGEKSHETQNTGNARRQSAYRTEQAFVGSNGNPGGTTPLTIIPSCFPFSPIFPCFGW